MNLRQYAREHGLTPAELGTKFGVTAAVVLRWIDYGVPPSRRADVVALTDGQVQFRDVLTIPESLKIRLTNLAILLEDFQTKLDDRLERAKVQVALEEVYRMIEIVEGKHSEKRIKGRVNEHRPAGK